MSNETSVENSQSSFDGKMNKIITVSVNIAAAVGIYALAIYMRRHLPAGQEAGFFRGMLDGANWLWFWGDSKESFMVYPHSFMYALCYWVNAIIVGANLIIIFWKSVSSGSEVVEQKSPAQSEQLLKTNHIEQLKNTREKFIQSGGTEEQFAEMLKSAIEKTEQRLDK